MRCDVAGSFVCSSDAFHPYECGGDCRHCRGHESSYVCPLCLDGVGLMTDSYCAFLGALDGYVLPTLPASEEARRG